ncbi:MAG: glycosyltransferase family 4 protein [Chloroflexi bacterium]|nr:glycosyltransferase family 4 protein [Chloroflexota bacterium]
MHILIVHQAFASINEPGGTRHHELAQVLTARGHRVTVIASPVSYLTGTSLHLPPFSEKIEGEKEGRALTILRAAVYDAHHKSFLHRVLAFLSFMVSSFWIGLGVKNVDVVWGTSPPIFQGVTAWILARLKGAKFLFEVRDLWPRFAIAVGVLRNYWLIRASEWLERTLYRSADRVMVNSPAYVSYVQGVALSGGWKPKSKGWNVELIPNGADPSMFDPADDGAAFRQAHHLAEKFVVMYAGAHGMSNDLEVVLEAARQLAEDTSEVEIVLVGDGKEKSVLMARAAAMSLPNVTFLPSVPKTGMAEALAAADACLAILKPLDEYKWTYPNKVFDYMAAGRPVALAIDGVIREVVEAADCGLFATPGNPSALAEVIRQLAQDRDHSRAMGLRGRAYLEAHFNRETMAENLLKMLEAMTAERKS